MRSLVPRVPRRCGNGASVTHSEGLRMSVQPHDKLAAALALAAKGFHVFPCWWIDSSGCCACGKPDCSAGKHPMTNNGLKDATCDPDIIRGWWEKCPEANIAIRTGTPSGIFVVDLDGEDGIAAWE